MKIDESIETCHLTREDRSHRLHPKHLFINPNRKDRKSVKMKIVCSPMTFSFKYLTTLETMHRNARCHSLGEAKALKHVFPLSDILRLIVRLSSFIFNICIREDLSKDLSLSPCNIGHQSMIGLSFRIARL